LTDANSINNIESDNSVKRQRMLYCLERVKTVDDGINEREHQLVTLFTYRYTDGDFLSLAVYEKKAENMEKRRPCSSFFVVCTVINHPDQ
jgi:hypothetical protein